MHTNKDVQDKLIIILHLHEDHLKHINDRFKMQEHLIVHFIYYSPGYLPSISNAVTYFVYPASHILKVIIQSAIDRKLAPGAFTTGAMEAILQYSKDIAKTRQFINPLDKKADNHELVVSSPYFSEKEELVLLALYSICGKTAPHVDTPICSPSIDSQFQTELLPCSQCWT